MSQISFAEFFDQAQDAAPVVQHPLPALPVNLPAVSPPVLSLAAARRQFISVFHETAYNLAAGRPSAGWGNRRQIYWQRRQRCHEQPVSVYAWSKNPAKLICDMNLFPFTAAQIAGRLFTSRHAEASMNQFYKLRPALHYHCRSWALFPSRSANYNYSRL